MTHPGRKEYGEEEIVAYKAYSIGDEIIYKGEKYYVINNSSEDEASVTTLKENPLTTSEIIEYGTGHINEYSSDSCLQSPGTVCDRNGYGGVAYYSKENCSYPNLSGCKSDYDSSDIKFIIDNWSSHNFAKNVLLNDTMGYKTRLITYDEIIDNFNYVLKNEGPSGMYFGPSSSTPNWIYNTQYWYWTMSTYNDSTSSVWRVTWNGTLKEEPVWAIADGYAFIRPVVTFNKRFI